MNHTKLFITCLFLLLIRPIVRSQQLKYLKGRVINRDDNRGIPFAQIASYQLRMMFAADSLGYFIIKIPPNDSLKIISLGFESQVFKTDNPSPANEDSLHIFPLKLNSYLLGQVDVNFYRGYHEHSNRYNYLNKKDENELHLHLPEDIKMGQESDIPAPLRPTFSQPPNVLDAIFSPLSFVYYHGSKSEKAKTKLLKIREKDAVRALMTRELIEEISGYKEKELDRFIVYCNTHIELSKSDDEYTIRIKVIDALNEYKKEKKS
ncbi:hypothetical protein DMA11_04640 [Marinilabiliaceae bacterium JC017]|nr:hypothetical protein DMA11_04640 [Marinilabiliaceae bacterium JC017]